jgi:uncharacterized membrane protein
MIQRIQTIYLLISLILIGLFFWFPIAELFVDGNSQYFFLYRGIYSTAGEFDILAISTVPLAILFTIIIILNLVSIFLYKNRLLQMRVSILNIMLMLGSLGLMYFYIWIAETELNAEAQYTTLMPIIPLISAILTFIAFKAINKDQKLVKSLDRIR